MTWKKVINSDPGDADHFGGNDIDKISDLFSGVADVDTLDINSNTTFRDQKFRARNPANTFSYIVGTSAITANRQATLPLLTADDTFVFANAIQTITNKTFNGVTVDFGGTLPIGTAGDPTALRWGTYQPLGAGTSNSTVGVLDGILGGHTGTGGGTASNAHDSTEGFIVSHTTAASSGTIAGIADPGGSPGIITRSKAVRLNIRWKASSTTTTRLYMGFSNLATLPVSDTVLGTADSGIIMGFNTALSNFTIWGNDGSGTAGAYDTGIAKDANFHTMEISWAASGNVTAYLDGVLEATISSAADLPAVATDLHCHIQIQTASATGRTVSFKGVWLESS
jgi:hypothetical protein